MQKLLFILPLLLLGTSCKKDSSEIDQAKIFQNYVMTYDEDLNKTTVSAYFYEDKLGGKNLELTGTSSVTMNGNAMTKNGTTYSTTVEGNLAVATLIFTDNDGKAYTNTINKANTIANDSQTYLDNSSTGYWYWYGSTITTDESVNLVLTNVADNSITASFNENVVGRSYVTLTGSSLSSLPEGNTKVEIKRSKSTTSGNFATVGGKISANFKALYNYVSVY